MLLGRASMQSKGKLRALSLWPCITDVFAVPSPGGSSAFWMYVRRVHHGPICYCGITQSHAQQWSQWMWMTSIFTCCNAAFIATWTVQLYCHFFYFFILQTCSISPVFQFNLTLKPSKWRKVGSGNIHMALHYQLLFWNCSIKSNDTQDYTGCTFLPWAMNPICFITKLLCELIVIERSQNSLNSILFFQCLLSLFKYILINGCILLIDRNIFRSLCLRNFNWLDLLYKLGCKYNFPSQRWFF